MGEKNCKLREYLMTGKELTVMGTNEGNKDYTLQKNIHVYIFHPFIYFDYLTTFNVFYFLWFFD